MHWLHDSPQPRCVSLLCVVPERLKVSLTFSGLDLSCCLHHRAWLELRRQSSDHADRLPWSSASDESTSIRSSRECCVKHDSRISRVSRLCDIPIALHPLPPSPRSLAPRPPPSRNVAPPRRALIYLGECTRSASARTTRSVAPRGRPAKLGNTVAESLVYPNISDITHDSPSRVGRRTDLHPSRGGGSITAKIRAPMAWRSAERWAAFTGVTDRQLAVAPLVAGRPNGTARGGSSGRSARVRIGRGSVDTSGRTPVALRSALTPALRIVRASHRRGRALVLP